MHTAASEAATSGALAASLEGTIEAGPAAAAAVSGALAVTLEGAVEAAPADAAPADAAAVVPVLTALMMFARRAWR